MWTALFLMVVAAVLLVNPTTRQTDRILIVACIALFTGTWIDKGLGLITGGFIPTPLHKAMDYTPTPIEVIISLGIYSIGALVLTILFKIAVNVKREALCVKTNQVEPPLR